MKKILITTNLLTLSILFIAWNGTNSLPDMGKQKKGCETKGHTFAEFEDVVDRYTTERWAIINKQFSTNGPNPNRTGNVGNPRSTNNFSDARSIWFSLDSLKQFICTIEKYTALMGTKKPDTLGIRLYYGVYQPDRVKFPFKHTIFLVPTYKKAGMGKGITGIDFDPRASVQIPRLTNGEGYVPFDSLRNNNKILALTYTPYGSGGQSLIGNDGDLCPPCKKGCIHDIID